MRAAVITRPGGPDVLEVREVARPEPVADHVLVRVRASALNRADLLQREGRYPPPLDVPQDIPGIEFAGEVALVGAGVHRWRPGQRVFGIVGGGAHAEYLTVHERMLAEIPANLDWAEAAATPEVFITAHDALVTQAGLRPSERVLIHAVGSGVGLAATQLVRAVGAIPYGTSRTLEKIDRAKEYGLEDGVVLTGDLGALAERVAAWTSSVGMQVVLELVGGPYVQASVDSLGVRGRLMLVGTMGGGQVQLNLRRVLSNRLMIRGTVLRGRPLEEKILASRAFAAEVVPLLERGLLRPTIDSRFPLDEIRAAHRHLETNATFGKVVLDMTDTAA